MITATTDTKPEVLTTSDARAPARPAPQKLIVQDDGPLSFMMDTGKFEHVQRFSAIMAASSLLPDHLCMEGKGQSKSRLPVEVVRANCFRIVNQAFRWQIDPYAMVDETYVVGGKLGYSGKLVAAVVNARAGLAERLVASYTGTGDNRTVTISGRFPNEASPRVIQLRLGDAKTDNQMWKKDPDQKLWYSGAVKWARRHCPEIVLGVLTDDDLERIRMDSSKVLPTAGKRIDKIAAVLADEDEVSEQEPSRIVDVTESNEVHSEETSNQDSEFSSESDTVEYVDQESSVNVPESAAGFDPHSGEDAKAYHLRLAKEIELATSEETLGAIQAAVNEAEQSKFLTPLRANDLNKKIDARFDSLN